MTTEIDTYFQKKINEAKAKRLTTLDLSCPDGRGKGRVLTHIPPEIFEMTWLVKLDFSDNHIASMPSEIGRLTNLKQLTITSWHSIPDNKKLTNLPPEIGQLTRLTTLDLYNNQLRQLPPEIVQLTHLTKLDLSFNQLSQLPPEIVQLTKLTSLNLSRNQLSQLPPEIVQLTHLTELSLYNNQLRQLPPEIGQLTKLTTLDLRHNQLSQLPSEIGQLTNLTSLDLGGNKLSQLPPEIGQLTNLTSLDLSGNQLSQLPPEIGHLTHLTTLDLSRNQLSQLPPEIGQLTKLTRLPLSRNPLESPPFEVATKGMAAIRAYFEQLAAEQNDTLYEAKLLIVGEPGAGKTTLARKLLNPQAALPQEGETTRGIDIETWEFPLSANQNLRGLSNLAGSGKESFRANLWDFGGQEIYHATHRFFLTKRSLYILVVDTRKVDTDLYYWLNIAELLGGDSPVLLVKNEKDNRPRSLNESHLRERFANLRGVFATNLADGRGLAALVDTIQFHLTHLPHVGDVLPKSWLEVRQALETDERNYLDWREFLALCERHGFKSLAQKETLSTYLHELGICLHYQDDPMLRRTVFLKPEWCTEAVYKVLDTPQIIQQHGHFTRAELDRIWHEPEYDFMRDELLQMMLKFKLCYPITGTEGHYIAPQLLSPQPPPYEWATDHNLQLRYRYPRFMPKGMVATFTVMVHRYIWQQTHVWKGGLILHRDDTLAEVVEDYEGRQIIIRLRGAQTRDLLRTIIDNVAEIHAGYHNLQYELLVPCNCTACLNRNPPHFYKYESLRRRQAKGIPTVECDNSFEDVPVAPLLEVTLGTSVGSARRGLPPGLKLKLIDALKACEQFADDRQLKALFVDERLITWENNLPDGESLSGRVELVIGDLYRRTNMRGENALTLLVEVLHEQIDAGDGLHHRLGQLAAELRAVCYTETL